jgi:putative oxidoreductase
MVFTQKLENWADRHHPVWLDLLRMGLGIFLFVKGIIFISDISELEKVILTINAPSEWIGWVSFWAAHYIAFAHLVGGLLIAMGLETRAAILFQLPILLGAVLFVRPGTNITTLNTDWWVSALTLALLLLFLIFDSGRWSLDNYMRNHPED